MIEQVVERVCDFRARSGLGPIDFYEILSNTGSHRKSRGCMLMHYLVDVKHGIYNSYRYCDFFEDLARKAFGIWRVKKGKNPISCGPDSPVCAGSPDSEPPICGNVKSVIAMMFALKMQNQNAGYFIHHSTERALTERPRDIWDCLDSAKKYPSLYDGPIELYMGCVYYNSTLFVTDDRSEFQALKEIAFSSWVN